MSFCERRALDCAWRAQNEWARSANVEIGIPSSQRSHYDYSLSRNDNLIVDRFHASNSLYYLLGLRFYGG